MKVKTAVLWWLVNNNEPNSLEEKDKKIESLIPLVDTLFPGINYFSITGFSEVMQNCVIPALRKRYHKLLLTPAEKIKPRAMTEVTAVLPSKGYEWQDSAEWKAKFKRILAVT